MVSKNNQVGKLEEPILDFQSSTQLGVLLKMLLDFPGWAEASASVELIHILMLISMTLKHWLQVGGGASQLAAGGCLQEALRRCAIDIDLPRHIIMLISDIRTDLVLLSGIKNPSHMNSLLAF